MIDISSSDNGALLPGVSDGVDAIRKKLDSLNGDIADLVRTQLTRAHESMLAAFNEMFENQVWRFPCLLYLFVL